MTRASAESSSLLRASSPCKHSFQMSDISIINVWEPCVTRMRVLSLTHFHSGLNGGVVTIGTRVYFWESELEHLIHLSFFYREEQAFNYAQKARTGGRCDGQEGLKSLKWTAMAPSPSSSSLISDSSFRQSWSWLTLSLSASTSRTTGWTWTMQWTSPTSRWRGGSPMVSWLLLRALLSSHFMIILKRKCLILLFL